MREGQLGPARIATIAGAIVHADATTMKEAAARFGISERLIGHYRTRIRDGLEPEIALQVREMTKEHVENCYSLLTDAYKKALKRVALLCTEAEMADAIEAVKVIGEQYVVFSNTMSEEEMTPGNIQSRSLELVK